MPPTIPIEEIRADLEATQDRITTLTKRSAELQAYVDGVTRELKREETRKAQLQDELEKQSNP